MELDKLEKLSCLKIKDSEKESLVKSLEGVFSMMHNLDKLHLSPIETQSLEPDFTHALAADKVQKEGLIKKSEEVSGLHLQEGYFLAPKAIKK